MQSKFYFTLALAGTLAMTSCNKLGELSADNFTVTPSPLEAVGGKVPVTINGRFPEKYMKRKAVVTVTPELRYAKGKAIGQSATFQGEKVQGNGQEISYKVGGNYTMRNSFTYVPDMQKSELYLTFNAYVGKKQVKVPEVKVADGVVATSDLLSRAAATGNAEIAPTIYPVCVKNIPIRVKNTFNPDAPGTIIKNKIDADQKPIKGISTTRKEPPNPRHAIALALG